MVAARPVLDRLAEKFEIDPESGCWNWTGSTTKAVGGYGQIWWDGKFCVAHRASYILSVGEIPEGLVIDHLCRNRLCVNPDHLEPVTSRENTVRGDLPTLLRSGALGRPRKNECKWGHSLGSGNRNPSGGCAPCARERVRAWNLGITREELRATKTESA